ncbi:dynein regulatory complex subunit 2-like [Daphnia pulex]|uniref:dynein regulatory complex subunit 2-like n=1 Tax=Daphnia pulex TaxID=6669 RepID=UPI001EDC9AB4|nr:dynein regulatory complex subunit 2-like [Daphnia pulex]
MAGGKKSDKWKAGGGKKGKGTKGEGKKKGGKKKAKPKLSEDAKNRQQEQRAAVEEERRRMREELINSFLRHKLLKEQNLTRLNQSKLIEKWRHVLRDAKSQELSRELELMKLDFDKRYSENITEINRLMESLLQNGLDFVQLCNIQKLETDRTFDEHVSRLNILANVYQQESNLFKATIVTDYTSAMTCHQQEKRSLLSTISTLQSHYRESYTAQKANFQIRKDDIINQGLEEEQTICQNLERRLEHSWQQLHENCVDSGELDEQRWALYSLLRRRDQIAYEQQRIAEIRLEKLAKAVNQIQEKRNCHEQGAQELMERRNELHERRERWRLRLLKQQQQHAERLKAVAANSSDAAEHLEQLVKQGVLILRSAQRCRLLKADHRPSSSSSSDSPPANCLLSEPFQHFWTRFNQAYLETVLLQRHQAAIVRGRTAETARLKKEVNIPTCWSLNGTTLPIHPEK